MFDKRTQNDTKKYHFFNSSTFDSNSAAQCTCMFFLSSHCHVNINWCFKLSRAELDEIASQTSAYVIRQLATTSRSSLIDDAIKNTLEMMWDIYSMSLDAQIIILSRLHLARVLVVTMTMFQHFLNNSCHANRARSKRSAVNRKLKNAEKEEREDSEWLEKTQMKNTMNSNLRS